MASSLFVNTVHVCFESVLVMDNTGMVALFESLVATGLKGFLGCPAVIHDAALLEFFENGEVRDGLVVSTMNGVSVEISEQLLAETFELPVEGLTDLLEIPKDLVFDAKSIVSFSGEPVSISGKKKEMKVEFCLLCDILAKTISVKAGSFDAITLEKFLMMAAIICGVRINWSRICFNILKDMVTPGTRQAKGYAIQIILLLENVPNLELGESSEFPSSKILMNKIVHRYAVLNDKAEPVVKKKRTTKSKPVSSKSTLETLPVEAVPLQMIAPTTAAPTEQPPLPKRKSQKRKRRLVLGFEDEIVDSEAAVGGTSVEQEPAVEHVFEEQQIDDVDDIIQQILTETAQLETDEEIETIDVADYFVEEPTEELETVVVEQSTDEAMSLEDIFLTIPVECPIPSAGVEVTKIILGKSISIPGVYEGGWYKAGLPKIPETDKGKAPLQERDPVKGNPVKEQILLTLADIECLVQLREQVIDEVDKFFNSFSFKKLPHLKIEEISAKEALILSWTETDSTRVALNRKMYILTNGGVFNCELLITLMDFDGFQKSRERLYNFFHHPKFSIVVVDPIEIGSVLISLLITS
ncbi:hypothetical protein F511_11564 [Dorcoceras hygrometricum]|uniref:Dystroglycan-like n=1 Tax=Dorcoceras hygrometricum TaxID=472368 RepID=A0A2Z7CXS0_9LAMI|nr:hypothetical protein F511_11564 [Dorcoceras hygrometricum]